MKYKEVHSIRAAREKITELEDRIENTRGIIAEIERLEKEGDFKNQLISTRNRRIGQYKRQIKYQLANIKLMKRINKSSNLNIY